MKKLSRQRRSTRPNPLKPSARKDLYDFFDIVGMPKSLYKPIEAAALHYDMEIEDIAKAIRPHKSHYGNASLMVADLDNYTWSNGIAAEHVETAEESLDELMIVGMKLLDHYGIEYFDPPHAGVLLSSAPFSLAMVAVGKSKDAVKYVIRNTLSEIELTIDGVDYSEPLPVLLRKHLDKPFDPKKSR